MNSPVVKDYFLCHASKDKPRVDIYAKRLTELGFAVAFDKYDITPGQDWVERILDLLASSRICVVFVSKHSTRAIVQGKEAFAARLLARQYPDRHQVIPVYLKGAPKQTTIHGLQTTSGFREEDQEPDAIADGLAAELRRMGDAADRATRAIDLIDEVALRWLYPPNHSYRGRYQTRGNRVVQCQIQDQEEYEAGTISRSEFDSKLRPDELDLIVHMEEKMEKLFEKWKENDLDAVTSKDAQQRADEFARRLGREVVKLLDLLSRAGFELVDHYQEIRAVVADYYRDLPPAPS